MPGGGLDNNTKLLLHLDGVDGAKTTTDSSATGHTVNFNNDAQLDTAQKKFGESSLLLDGTDDWLDIPTSAEFDITNTSKFAIDLVVRWNDITPTQWIFSRGATDLWGIFLTTDSKPVAIGFAAATLTSADAIVADKWYHIAVTGDGTDVRFFVAGILKDTDTQSITAPTGDTSLIIGTNPTSLGTQDFNGWIDEVRFSNGSFRWARSFTPPIKEYVKFVPGGGFTVGSNPAIY